MLQRTLGRGVRLIASGSAVARRAEHLLAVRGMENAQEGEGEYRFLCTGDVEAFRTLGTRFLQMPLGEVTHVDLRPAAAA
jgi:glutamate racemase